MKKATKMHELVSTEELWFKVDCGAIYVYECEDGTFLPANIKCSIDVNWSVDRTIEIMNALKLAWVKTYDYSWDEYRNWIDFEFSRPITEKEISDIRKKEALELEREKLTYERLKKKFGE